jgi:DNA polymerase-1
MQIPTEGIKKGKTGYSTAASELEKLREGNPIIEFVEEHRELAKLQNTYVDVLPTLINKKTGRIHTSFNQAVASTGRLSSSDPNLQNIPIRTELGKEIRKAFIAEEGNVLISADYSQIELRIVASLAKDEKMIEIFAQGEDIHRATAAAINGVPLDKVTKEMRSAAKEVNFGVLYGMGAYGLSWRTGISQAEAREFIQKYFEQFSGVKKYLDQTLVFAKENGYVETLFGRRRYIPELLADNYQLRNAGERMAINMPIQGTAADLMKMAMVSVYAEIKNLKSKIQNHDDVRMILQVHDELVLEVKKGLEEEVGEMVKETMEQVAQPRVPVEVHVAVGTRWGELK